MFPLFSMERIDRRECNEWLSIWGHRIGPCVRPFGHQSFVILKHGEPVAVAHSATLVRNSVYGFERKRTVELARLCADPKHREMTRVMLRLYRAIAREEWAREYWRADHILSYARLDWHSGDLYRFDGWRKVTDTRASAVTTGSRHSKPQQIFAKRLWVWPSTSTPGVA